MFVTFTGEDRTSSTGIPIDVKGWWEIRGLSFRAGQEVAYALANDLHMMCRVKRDVVFGKYPAGCTLVVTVTVPDMVG